MSIAPHVCSTRSARHPRGFVERRPGKGASSLRTVAIRFDLETFEVIRDTAKDSGVSFATIVRKLVQEALTK